MALNKQLRSADKAFVFLLGKCKNEILGAKLPSMMQVLQFFFYKMRVENNSLKSSIKMTISVVSEFWKRANVPIMSEQNCIKALERLYNKWRNLQKNAKSKYEKHRENEKEFLDWIENYIFDISSSDALEKMKIQQDKDFLLLQRQRGRPGSMSGVDIKMMRKQKRKEKRLELEKKRIENHRKKVVDLDLTSDEDILSPILEDNPNDFVMLSVENDSEEEIQGQGQGQKTRGSIQFIDDRILASLDKCKVSTRDAMHIISATASALLSKIHEINPTSSSITLDDLILNRSTIQLMRTEYRRKQANKILESFNIPEVFVLHWDGKLLPEIKGKEKSERLGLVVSSKNVEKLLGIPKIKDSSGDNIAEAIYEFLVKWQLENLVEIISFDTTASNTGIYKGAAYLLEKKLNRDLLFLPCRHHISELLIRAVFEQHFGATSGPEVLIFNRFSKFWPNIIENNFKSGLADEEVQKAFTVEELENHKKFCLEALKSQFVRADYKEVLQLSLLFIGEEVPNFSGFRSPGATTHARFMAKNIYCYKMFIFREQFKLTTAELKSLRNICIFLTRIYVAYWFGCVEAVNAPRLDLKLINDVTQYYDSKTSKLLLKKLVNHLWYLSEESVALSFFDDHVSDDIKQQMVNALGNIDNEEEYEETILKKIKATVDDVLAYAGKNLSHFVSVKTRRLFSRLHIDCGFLKTDPSTWKNRDDFLAGKRICENLAVVNDAAERAVKLITDFNRALTYDEEDKQYLLQVVEHYRQIYPSHTKRSLLQNAFEK